MTYVIETQYGRIARLWEWVIPTQKTSFKSTNVNLNKTCNDCHHLDGLISKVRTDLAYVFRNVIFSSPTEVFYSFQNNHPTNPIPDYCPWCSNGAGHVSLTKGPSVSISIRPSKTVERNLGFPLCRWYCIAEVRQTGQLGGIVLGKKGRGEGAMLIAHDYNVQ